MPELTDLSVIRNLCEKYDFALSKGFGQNFIINRDFPLRSWMPAAWTNAMVLLRSTRASVS